MEGMTAEFDAGTLTEFFYASAGTMAKYASPTVANGRVYVATEDSNILVFGLLNSSGMRGAAVIRGGATLR